MLPPLMLATIRFDRQGRIDGIFGHYRDNYLGDDDPKKDQGPRVTVLMSSPGVIVWHQDFQPENSEQQAAMQALCDLAADARDQYLKAHPISVEVNLARYNLAPLYGKPMAFGMAALDLLEILFQPDRIGFGTSHPVGQVEVQFYRDREGHLRVWDATRMGADRMLCPGEQAVDKVRLSWRIRDLTPSFVPGHYYSDFDIDIEGFERSRAEEVPGGLAIDPSVFEITKLISYLRSQLRPKDRPLPAPLPIAGVVQSVAPLPVPTRPVETSVAGLWARLLRRAKAIFQREISKPASSLPPLTMELDVARRAKVWLRSSGEALPAPTWSTTSPHFRNVPEEGAWYFDMPPDRNEVIVGRYEPARGRSDVVVEEIRTEDLTVSRLHLKMRRGRDRFGQPCLEVSPHPHAFWKMERFIAIIDPHGNDVTDEGNAYPGYVVCLSDETWFAIGKI